MLGAGGLLTLALPGCARQGSDGFKVVTTFTIIADMARNVAGDAAEVESITKAGAEIHNYQPTPGDLVKAQGADLILWNGPEPRTVVRAVLRQSRDVPSAVVSKGVEPIGIGEGPYTGRPNPHAWMSPAAALIYVDNIRDALVRYDPTNAETYRRKRARLQAAHRSHGRADPGPPGGGSAGAPLAGVERGRVHLSARDFNLRELYLWPINADQQGTPQQVRR
jgi:manganese/iron transport system substrate-binding protein